MPQFPAGTVSPGLRLKTLFLRLHRRPSFGRRGKNTLSFGGGLMKQKEWSGLTGG